MHGEALIAKNVGLKPASELANGKPHGIRIQYLAGCRCIPCRAANSRYQSERLLAHKRGEWNGFVPAEKARKHLQALSQMGVGKIAVSEVTGITRSTLDLIRTGKRKNLRALNEKKILSVTVDAASDGAYISAEKTWDQIRWLLDQGFTGGDLALRLGYKTARLQLRKGRVRASNALKVQRLYDRLHAGEDDE
jgi:hypothetical protein